MRPWFFRAFSALAFLVVMFLATLPASGMAKCRTPDPTTTTLPPTSSTTVAPTTTTIAPTTTTQPPLTIGYKPWSGGPGYWSKFPKAAARGWTDPAFFPIGVWFESVTSAGDIATDKDAGLNTYVVLTDSSNFKLVSDSGMSMIVQQDTGQPGQVGWFGDDESDMQQGPVTGPPHMQAIEDQLRAKNDGRFIQNNYGKGVLFWESDSDAAKFVNNYQDVVSTDLYWFTDPNARSQSEGGSFFGLNRDLTQAESEQAANYGAQVDDVYRLMVKKPNGDFPMPQFGFVEVGQPWTENVPTIAPAEVKAAVWSNLIHGATGIVYFNHTFGPTCTSQHVLRDPCYTAVRAAVKDTNARITSLAPVLNSQSLDLSLASGVDTMVKRYAGQTYVFAQPSRNQSGGTRTLTLPSGLCGPVTVMFESRTLPTGCGITDTFADGNAVHIYRVG